MSQTDILEHSQQKSALSSRSCMEDLIGCIVHQCRSQHAAIVRLHSPDRSTGVNRNESRNRPLVRQFGTAMRARPVVQGSHCGGVGPTCRVVGLAERSRSAVLTMCPILELVRASCGGTGLIGIARLGTAARRLGALPMQLRRSERVSIPAAGGSSGRSLNGQPEPSIMSTYPAPADALSETADPAGASFRRFDETRTNREGKR